MHHDEHDKGQLALEVKSAPEPDFWVSKPEQKETRWVLSMMLVAIILTCLSLPLNILAVGSYNGTKECVVKPHPKGGDSVPAILNAFRECGQNGKITFLNETYNINTVMTTTGLNNVEVDIQGTLLWSTNINYWLNSSLPMGYQNQSTAWRFGGNNVYLHGNGYGTLDGNGQVWYDFINGQSNYPRRPHQITFTGIYNSVIADMRFVQSQMWTMTIIEAENVLLENIYISSTSNDSSSTVNTDGADTIYANNITFRNWQVTNGDDCVSTKANSTNILIEDVSCRHGGGIALGSIGQYASRYEFMENITAHNISFDNNFYVGYIKTFTGVQQGYPPNGGGGGKGFLKNVSFSDFTVQNTSIPFVVTQCVSFEGADQYCNTSLFNLEDISFTGLKGTLNSGTNGTVAQIQCSGDSPCHGFEIKDVDLKDDSTGKIAELYECDNVVQPEGFACTASVPEKRGLRLRTNTERRVQRKLGF